MDNSKDGNNKQQNTRNKNNKSNIAEFNSEDGKVVQLDINNQVNQTQAFGYYPPTTYPPYYPRRPQQSYSTLNEPSDETFFRFFGYNPNPLSHYVPPSGPLWANYNFNQPPFQPFPYPHNFETIALPPLPEVDFQSEEEMSPQSEESNVEHPARFVLLEQPNAKQRKSYRNENRCLLPNPLTIGLATTTEPQPNITRGRVQVQLVDREGNPLLPPRDNLLESLEGTLSLPLNEKNSTSFSLKVLDTSEGDVFRLLFTVDYILERIGPRREKILSRPFTVNSNRRKSMKVRVPPHVFGIKPQSGPHSEETEVWIKGRNFFEKVGVDFGEHHGKVVEVLDNIITVMTPTRPELTRDTDVPVKVFNKFGMERLEADFKPKFSYKVENIVVSSKSEEEEAMEDVKPDIVDLQSN